MTIKIDETTLEIIRELEKGESHSREIARKTKINRTTTNQRLKHLREEGIIKAKISGKNKIYKLNKSTKTEQIIKLMKEQTLLKIMEQEKSMNLLIKKLKKINATIILFGSYAKKTNKKNSDADIIIITKNIKEAKKTIKEIQQTTNIKISAQYTEELDTKNPLIKEIKKTGITIKNEQEIY